MKVVKEFRVREINIYLHRKRKLIAKHMKCRLSRKKLGTKIVQDLSMVPSLLYSDNPKSRKTLVTFLL